MKNSKPKSKQRVARLVAGKDALVEWFGSGGKPVDPIRAEVRARGCAGCKKNVQEDWFEELTGRAARLARRILEAKNRLSVRTSLDEKLKVCEVCGCDLKTKVHVPIEHIKNHTPEEELKEMKRVGCWIPLEIE